MKFLTFLMIPLFFLLTACGGAEEETTVEDVVEAAEEAGEEAVEAVEEAIEEAE